MERAALAASRLIARLKAWLSPAARERASPPAPQPREPFPNYFVYAWCDPWPSKQDMLGLLRAHGLAVEERAYAVQARIDGRAFAFEVYGGDIGDPQADACDHDLRRLSDHTAQVSAALTAAGVRHRLEILDDGGDTLAGCFHNGMPDSPDDAPERPGNVPPRGAAPSRQGG